jgi:hypothetical protein
MIYDEMSEPIHLAIEEFNKTFHKGQKAAITIPHPCEDKEVVVSIIAPAFIGVTTKPVVGVYNTETGCTMLVHIDRVHKISDTSEQQKPGES